MITNEYKLINAFKICFNGIETILTNGKKYPGLAKTLQKFLEVLIAYIGPTEQSNGLDGNDFDVQIAGLSFYARLNEHLIQFDKEVKMALFKNYTEMLETFLLAIQCQLINSIVLTGNL